MTFVGIATAPSVETSAKSGGHTISARQDYPSSDPLEDVSNSIRELERTAVSNAKAIARGGLPEPLLFRAVNIAPGPPPTFQIEIVNPETGGVIVLGTI